MWGVRRLRRRGRIVVGVVAALVVAWLVAGTVLLVFPRRDHPSHVDAVIMLGPPGTARLDAALELMGSGASGNLVLSIPGGLAAWPIGRVQDLCTRPQSFRVYCFAPDPATTRGEAQEVDRLATEHGWGSVAVVTSRYHLSRARFVFHRCTDLQVSMVESSGDRIPFYYWGYQYLYQTAGFAKALLQWNC